MTVEMLKKKLGINAIEKDWIGCAGSVKKLFQSPSYSYYSRGV